MFSVIVFGIFMFLFVLTLIFQSEEYRKQISKAKKDAYMEGWNDASDSLKNYDLNSYLDTKYAESKKK
jgi:hypothetical protein